MPEGDISIDDPRAPDVTALLERHLAFANAHSPPEDVHALDVDGLLDPAGHVLQSPRTTAPCWPSARCYCSTPSTQR